jgi:hypothetical protein
LHFPEVIGREVIRRAHPDTVAEICAGVERFSGQRQLPEPGSAASSATRQSPGDVEVAPAFQSGAVVAYDPGGSYGSVE